MSTLKQLVDETTNIKDEIITCYSNLKNNLIEKDIILESDPMPKLSELINKVGEFENFKYAQGAVSDGFFSVYDWGGTETKHITFSTPLDFIPKTLILKVTWSHKLYKEDKNNAYATNMYISNKGIASLTTTTYSPALASSFEVIEITKVGATVRLTTTKTSEATIHDFVALSV